MKILSFTAEHSIRRKPVYGGVLCIFKTTFRQKTLTTFVAAHSLAEAETEAERRLRELEQTGSGPWYDVTDEEVDQVMAEFNSQGGSR